MSSRLQFGLSPWRRSASALILALGCTGLWALFPATGLGAPGDDATIQVQPFTVPSNQLGEGQAFCPSGSRVTGGGVTQSSGTPSGTQVRQSGPYLPNDVGNVGRTWYARVFNNTGNDATYVSTAICSPTSDATVQVQPFTIPSSMFGDGQAFCPSGSRIVGGGVTQSSGNTSSRVGLSGPTGLALSSWDATINNFSTAQNTFVSTAICSPTSDATISVAPFTVQSNQDGDGQASCPSASRVVGGGVIQTLGTPFQSGLQLSGPRDESGLSSDLANGDVARSWYANVRYFGGGTGTFVSTAICAPSKTGNGPNGGGNEKSQLKFGEPKLNTQKGTAILPVTVPGPGTLTLAGKDVVKKRPTLTRAGHRLARKVTKAGSYKLKVKAKGAKKAELFATGKVTVKVVVTFKPTSGDAVHRTKKIKLKKS